MNENVRICLVNPSLKGPYPPLGLAYIAGYLSKYGKYNYDLKIVDGNCTKDILGDIVDFKPNIVGFTALSQQIEEAVAISQRLRKYNSRIFQILGGIHVSAEPRFTIRRGGFDVAVIGEGEVTFCEIVDAYISGKIDPDILKSIKGIAFLDNNQYLFTNRREEISDLDLIPHPARDLLNMEHYLSYYLLVRGLLGNRVATIHTSRGCPFRCVFCSCNIVFQKVRYFSCEYIISELKELVERYKVKSIFFTDDIFVLNKRRVKNLCESIIASGLSEKISWEVQGRASLIDWEDLELLKLMKKAGCVQIDYGFESGSDRILRFLKKTQASVDINERAIEVTKKSGLHVMGTFMIGVPGETDDEVEKTKQFIINHRDGIDFFQTFIATPYPGTELYEICRKRNIVKNDYFDQIKQEKGRKRLKVYSDTANYEKIVNTFRFLNSVSFKKIGFKHKLRWIIHNLIENPIETIQVIINFVNKKVRA